MKDHSLDEPQSGKAAAKTLLVIALFGGMAAASIDTKAFRSEAAATPAKKATWDDVQKKAKELDEVAKGLGKPKPAATPGK